MRPCNPLRNPPAFFKELGLKPELQFAAMSARWFWQSDTGWVEYDAAVAAKIEQAFSQKKSECKVDDQRFVDFDEMLQRRYDDKMKRRAVKREAVVGPVALPPPPPLALTKAQKLFDKQVFYLLIKLPKKKEKLMEDISKAGGLVADAASDRVTHVVSSEAEVSHFQDLVDIALKLKLPVVNSEFVRDSIEEEEVQDDKSYLLQCSKKGTTAPTSASPPASPKKSNNGNKRSAHDLLSEALKKKKPLSGTKLTPYPFEMRNTGGSPDSFQAEITWPTLAGCKTKVKGKIPLGDQIEFEEFDFVKGDEVELPNTYKGAVSKSTTPGLEGSFKDNLGNEGRWQLSMYRL